MWWMTTMDGDWRWTGGEFKMEYRDGHDEMLTLWMTHCWFDLDLLNWSSMESSRECAGWLAGWLAFRMTTMFHRHCILIGWTWQLWLSFWFWRWKPSATRNSPYLCSSYDMHWLYLLFVHKCLQKSCLINFQAFPRRSISLVFSTWVLGWQRRCWRKLLWMGFVTEKIIERVTVHLKPDRHARIASSSIRPQRCKERLDSLSEMSEITEWILRQASSNYICKEMV